MYNYNLSVKKLKESHRTFSKKNAQTRWLKNYHEQIQPKLLEHYDARVNAFIKRIEEKPQTNAKMFEHEEEPQPPPWNFALGNRSHRSYTTTKFRVKTAPAEENQSIWRSSSYIPLGPLGQHQFRQRDKTKEIKPKSTINEMLYKKYKDARKNRIKNNEKNINKMPQAITIRKPYQDNRSDGPSVYEDNVSMRYSVNSEMENIEKQALQYEKNQQITERKDHFKRLVNLQVTVNDKRAKNSIHHLLVKEGKKKQKKKAEGQEVQTDLLKVLFAGINKQTL